MPESRVGVTSRRDRHDHPAAAKVMHEQAFWAGKHHVIRFISPEPMPSPLRCLV